MGGWAAVFVVYNWRVCGGPFLCLKLGVCVVAPSCASALVCVLGVLLLPQPWRVCGGPFSCLKLGVCVGCPSCASDLEWVRDRVVIPEPTTQY